MLQGKGRSYSQGSCGRGFSVEDKGREISLLCALLGQISLGRGCPGISQVWAVPQLCLCAHTPLCPQQFQRLILGHPGPSTWAGSNPRAGADGSGGNMSGIPAHLPVLPISLAGLGHQHSLREYEPCVPSSAETRTGTWAGRGGAIPPAHTGSSGYLAASTQAGSCGRLGAKAGLPPGIVSRPQLGRIIKDSSARERRWGGSLCPVGVPGLREHSPAARDTLCLHSPQVGAVGAHRWVLRVVGARWAMDPRAGAAWHGHGWQAPAACPHVCRTPRWGPCWAGA